MEKIKFIYTNNENFKAEFEELLGRGGVDMSEVEGRVKTILDEVKTQGDSALIAQIARFDRWNPSDANALKVDKADILKAYKNTDEKLKKAIHTAYERIWRFHELQKPRSFMHYEENGSILGQKVTPVEKAGLYIPGGKAAYPSSLLMNAIPALVAGVEEIVVTTPAMEGEVNELLLAACHICKIDTVFKVGGASAVGALAYGTASIPKVDVITGPGNIYVATAKKLVYGEVNIDMIAGPSEIGIIADSKADPRLIAIDLLSQAEHDEMASSILATDSVELAQKVSDWIDTLVVELNRKEIAEKSIYNRGAILITEDLQESIALMNKIAPEHLELMVENHLDVLPRIKNAGAIFIGKNTPEPIGDYMAGPNHTLPTGGTARFYSPLGTEHFMKKSSVIYFSDEAINELGEDCAAFASAEGLEAHEKSVRFRLK